jgi:hypothetical protein
MMQEILIPGPAILRHFSESPRSVCRIQRSRIQRDLCIRQRCNLNRIFEQVARRTGKYCPHIHDYGGGTVQESNLP